MEKEGEHDICYTVYFAVADHKECGQQLSEIFLSERECVSDASKQNRFKHSLLNKCEDEFNKQDVCADWKAEKKAHEQSKSSLTDKEDAKNIDEDLEFRRIKIKKQMLGNFKFIGQLYKKSLLNKEKIMRHCASRRSSRLSKRTNRRSIISPFTILAPWIWTKKSTKPSATCSLRVWPPLINELRPTL
jgi:hypothetical protein